jgi:hypothetical protein
MKDWVRRPTTRAAIGFVLVAILIYAPWRSQTGDSFRAWVPNIVTALIGISITITLVEWVVRREARDLCVPETRIPILSSRKLLMPLRRSYSGTNDASPCTDVPTAVVLE